MSRQYQDPNNSGHYQNPNPNFPQQHGRFTQSLPIPINDRPQGHHTYSSYPEGSLQPSLSGQEYISRSPDAVTVSFREPHLSPAGPPQPYFPPSPTMPNLTVGTHQHGRRGSYGHPPPTGSSSDAHQLYAASASSYSGSGSNFYSQPGVQPHTGGGYTTSDTQLQDWNAGEYGEHDFRAKGPSNPPMNTTPRPLCRYPSCNNRVLFDRRVNELREWCEQHMQDAIEYGMEEVCKICRIWPRRNGLKLCSGDICRYPGIYPVRDYRPKCRYPGCKNYVHLDTRFNRRCEWCSDGHMRDAIARRMEHPCKRCRTWPRWRNFEFCGGDVCIHPYYSV